MPSDRPRGTTEGRYRTLFDYAPDGIIIADADGVYLDANPSLCRMLGYQRDEIVGKTAAEIVVPPEVRHIDSALATINADTLHNRQWKFRRKDGSEFSADVIATKMPDGEILAMVRDLSERERAEARIAEQAALLDQTQDAILVRDLEHRVLYWNRGAERMYGWTAAEAVGRSVVDILYRDPAPLFAAMTTVLRDGYWTGEIEQLNRSGQPLTIESRWALMRDEHGAPRSVLAVNTDVTERKRLEEQFLRAQRMESVGRLAGGIAHDLNNVLTPILICTELLRRETHGAEAEELLDTVRASAKRGADLIRQVLSFSRGLDGERIAIDAFTLLADLITVTRETFPRSINVMLEPCSRDLMIQGDPTQLHQVFLNLLVNARDAMPDGGRLSVTIEQVTVDDTFAAMHFESQPGKYVRIAVADSGTGIPVEHRSKIFEPFFTTKAFGVGTGLGLSTTVGIVKSHGGFINLYTEVGKGSRFSVYLPSLAADLPVPEAPQVPEAPARGRNEVVLLVDDEDAIRTVTERTLRRHGYQVITAMNGAEAVSIYVRDPERISVVLTDMTMPVMGGAALIVALRTINPSVKIIASSGMEDLTTHGSDSGVDKFLQKPYTADSMLRAIESVLSETS